MNLNNVVIGGTLTRDPEIRNTTGGNTVANFTIALNENWTDQNGQKQEKAHFIDVVFWGRKAEVIGEYFGKGGVIAVTGKLQQQNWEDRETGAKRSKLVVQGWDFQFCGRNRAGEGQQQTAMAAAGQAASEAQDEEEDDIPF